MEVDPTAKPAGPRWTERTAYLEAQNAELVAIIKLYLLTAERGTLTKGRKKMELADIDAEAREMLARYGR